MSSRALVTAIGAAAASYRRLRGLDAIDAKPHAGWPMLLGSLREHGVDGAPRWRRMPTRAQDMP